MGGWIPIAASCEFRLIGRWIWSPNMACRSSKRQIPARVPRSPRNQPRGGGRPSEIVMRVRRVVITLMGAAWMGAAALAHAQPYKDRQTAIAASVLPPGLRDVGLDQKLNAQVPLELKFR